MTELAALAEMADDETEAALQDIASPGHAGSSTSPAQASHCGRMLVLAQVKQQMMQMHAVPERILPERMEGLSSNESSSESLPVVASLGVSRPHVAGLHGLDAPIHDGMPGGRFAGAMLQGEPMKRSGTRSLLTATPAPNRNPSPSPSPSPNPSPSPSPNPSPSPSPQPQP